MIQPGDSASFKVDIKCDQELGPQLVKLPINITGSMPEAHRSRAQGHGRRSHD